MRPRAPKKPPSQVRRTWLDQTRSGSPPASPRIGGAELRGPRVFFSLIALGSTLWLGGCGGGDEDPAPPPQGELADARSADSASDGMGDGALEGEAGEAASDGGPARDVAFDTPTSCGVGLGSSAACQTCYTTACCKESNACALGTDCRAYVQCLRQCGADASDACKKQCSVSVSGKAAFDALVACAAAPPCSQPCP